MDKNLKRILLRYATKTLKDVQQYRNKEKYLDLFKKADDGDSSHFYPNVHTVFKSNHTASNYFDVSWLDLITDHFQTRIGKSRMGIASR